MLDKLKQIREEKGLSHKELAEILDIPEGMLIMIELGELIPTEKVMEKIEEFIIDSI